MTQTKDLKASGEILLYYKWKEYGSGYQDEETESAALKVSEDGRIVLNIYSAYDRFAPGSIGSRSEVNYSISVSDLMDMIREKVTADERTKKIENLKCRITAWDPETQSTQELYDLLITARQYAELKEEYLRPEIRFCESSTTDPDYSCCFSFEETINGIEEEFDEGFVICCDSEGDCIIEHDFEFFTEGMPEDYLSDDLTLKHISEIWSKLEEWQHFCYISTKDD
jgi:hypothetical protein